MKKFVFGLVLGLLLAISVTALAATDSGIRLIINGTDITPTMDVAPQMIEGRTMVPARYVAEALGATVTWDEVTRSVIVMSSGQVSGQSETSGLGPQVGYMGGGSEAEEDNHENSWYVARTVLERYGVTVDTYAPYTVSKDGIELCSIDSHPEVYKMEDGRLYINEYHFSQLYKEAGF